MSLQRHKGCHLSIKHKGIKYNITSSQCENFYDRGCSNLTSMTGPYHAQGWMTLSNYSQPLRECGKWLLRLPFSGLPQAPPLLLPLDLAVSVECERVFWLWHRPKTMPLRFPLFLTKVWPTFPCIRQNFLENRTSDRQISNLCLWQRGVLNKSYEKLMDFYLQSISRSSWSKSADLCDRQRLKLVKQSDICPHDSPICK